MSYMNDTITYLKISAKGLFKRPRLKTLYSSFKYYFAWRRYHGTGRNSVIDKMPWLSFSAIDFLKKTVQPDMLVFEYGSGGSTLFWASRTKYVISVEHDRSWFEKMHAELTRDQIKNVDYLLAEPQEDPLYAKKSIQNPDDYISEGKNYSGKNFQNYVKTIDKYPDEHFDIIIVDGRARPSCIKHAAGKLRHKGYLVIDNTERRYYLSSFHFNKREWKTREFDGPVPYIYHFSQTTILKKY
jgi:SAM-dependent methyltransferase